MKMNIKIPYFYILKYFLRLNLSDLVLYLNLILKLNYFLKLKIKNIFFKISNYFLL